MGPDNRSIQRLLPVGTAGALPPSTPPRPLASLAPRGVGAILDAAFEILRARFWICLGLAVPIWIPVQALAVRMPEPFTGGETFELSFARLAVQLGLTFAVQSLVVGVLCRVVYDELQAREPDLRSVLGSGLRRGPGLLGLTLITTLLSGLGWMCCMLPGLLVAWLLMVAPAALMLEELGPRAALSRSVRLMSGSFWRWLGVFVTQTLLLLPVIATSSALSRPGASSLIERQLGWPPGAFEPLSVLLLSILSGAGTAFGAVVMTLFYLDCRVRLEGFDLQLRFERLSEGRSAR